MKFYKDVSELERDLEYARKNPNDLFFFNTMLLRYRNSDNKTQKDLKILLMDRMLEFNPIFLIEKVAQENPDKMIICNTQEDPFFFV